MPARPRWQAALLQGSRQDVGELHGSHLKVGSSEVRSFHVFLLGVAWEP